MWSGWRDDHSRAELWVVIEAGFDSVCACGARIREGDPIGRVDGEWCCEACVAEWGEDEWTGDGLDLRR